MAESQTQILEMLRENKITVEEAEKLLSLIGSDARRVETPRVEAAMTNRVPKYLMVQVEPGSNGDERVNIRVPLNLIRAGMKLTSLIPPRAAEHINEELRENGIDFDLRNIKPGDLDELIESLAELKVDVDSERGDKVHIYVQ